MEVFSNAFICNFNSSASLSSSATVAVKEPLPEPRSNLAILAAAPRSKMLPAKTFNKVAKITAWVRRTANVAKMIENHRREDRGSTACTIHCCTLATQSFSFYKAFQTHSS